MSTNFLLHLFLFFGKYGHLKQLIVLLTSVICQLYFFCNFVDHSRTKKANFELQAIFVS